MELSRRNFLALGSAAALSGAAIAATGCSPSTSSSSSGSSSSGSTSDSAEVITEELDIPEEAAPSQTSYECDVLVVGCGVAGLHAVAGVVDQGKSVVVVEKGYPGYGGLSPFAVNTNFFDPDYGDDKEKTLTFARQANENVANLNWMSVWCDDSKDYFQRITDWGLTETYPHASETEYWVDGQFYGDSKHDDKRGYFQSAQTAAAERHPKVAKALEDMGVTVVDHTMVFDVIENDDRIAGAIALHVPSGTIITFKAKAVVLCTGSGSIKPIGFPTGAPAFDGLYIGYKHGLPITGMEFEDYHLSYGGQPGLILTTAGWAYCEQLAPGGPGVNADTDVSTLWGSGYQQKMVYGNTENGLATPDPTKQRVNSGKPASDDPNDIRQGNFTSPEVSWTAPGAAPGMSLHMVSGIHNDWSDVDGQTSIDGLYCAGDGTYASAIGGADYDGISGLTTSSCGVQGYRAGTAAAQYADSVEALDLPEDTVSELTDEIMAPLSVEKGYDPNFVNNELLKVMSSSSVLYRKSEETLNAALTQIEYIRDFYVPRLKAKNSHELRLCREVVQKTTAMEIKLRCSLERKESRGMHHRVDYPYRDDAYLGYFAATKTDDGMDIEFVDIPDEWKGDLSQSYEERYAKNYRFAGETEAKGLPEQKQSSY